MTKRKTLKELTLKDNFMFGAVMCNAENCRRLLELVLEFPIEHIEVSKEKCMIYHPEYKGVRLDVYAKDSSRTHYNVEMQSIRQTELGKRSRYYHSQIDMELLTSGAEYQELPKTYVIFVCDFDPFDERKYRYTFRNMCAESVSVQLGDGNATIFLNTKGRNPEDISPGLVKFLEYVAADLDRSMEDFGDSYVEQLQESVSDIKRSRGMEERYMLTELLMQDERRAGRAEGLMAGRKYSILEALEEVGALSEELRTRIMEETDINKLREWTKLVIRVNSIEQFVEKM